MGNSPTSRITVDIEIRHIGDRFLSACPALDLFSQGDTEEEAKNHLLDALNGFLETCQEMGTLQTVLSEAGLLELDAGYPIKRMQQSISLPPRLNLGRQHEAQPHQI